MNSVWNLTKASNLDHRTMTGKGYAARRPTALTAVTGPGIDMRTPLPPTGHAQVCVPTLRTRLSQALVLTVLTSACL